ncbi:MAG: patatin-like phospholipase family protein [Anditalea sp.]
MLVDKTNETLNVKRSLILAGGGMRVAYQAGVLLALEESGIKFTHVDGTSGGIFNTAMLASGLQPKEIAERWRTLKISHFVSGRKFKNYLNPFFMSGYADADNIRGKVFPHLGIDLEAIHQNESINATFNVCNFSDKTIKAFGNIEVQVDHLIAGVSLPIFMPALQIGDDWYTDAVWIKDANLLEGIKQQSQELWVVWAIGNSRSYYPGAFNQYVHMIEMSANGALLEEYNQISLINKAIAQGTGGYSQKEPIKLFLIKSLMPLPLDPELFFNKVNTRELINMGYENAKSYLGKQPVLAEKMDKNATRSSDPGAVLSFRATFDEKLKWDSVESLIIFYTYMRLDVHNEDQNFSVFSSIYIAALNQEIPAYGHQVRRIKHKDFTLLNISAKLLINQEEYLLRSVLKLHSPLEVIMGLGLKKISLTIKKRTNDLEVLVLQGNLYQSISNRLKACYSTNVKTEKGKAGGIGKRYKLISKLMDNEI